MKHRSRFSRFSRKELSVLLFSLLFLLLAGPAIFKIYEHAPSSVELGFFSFSPVGPSGGEILPASCESGYTHGAPDSCDFLNFSADIGPGAPGWHNGPGFQGYTPPGQLPYGGSANLFWSLEEAYWNGPIGQLQNCQASDGWSGEKTASMYAWGYQPNPVATAYAREGGETVGPLYAPTTFTLACRIIWADGSVGTATKNVLVDVAGAPVSVNQPPDTPSISGATLGYPGTYSFSMIGNDPDTNQIRYGMDWDNNGTTVDDVDEWTSFVDSGMAASLDRTLSVGIYTFQALAQDTASANSGFSSPHTIEIINVPCPCDRATLVCAGESYSASGPNCSTNDSCVGRRFCEFNWQEIAP